MPGLPEIFYAAKANPDVPILRALAPYVDGIEVASGGELAYVREGTPGRAVGVRWPRQDR